MILHYRKSTHAPLFKRYMGDKGFVEVGEESMYGRVDPETGAEYRALGGDDHRYSKDYKVGSSYPPATFVYASEGGDALTHDELEEKLKEEDLWSDALEPVILPKGYEYGEVTWWYGFQFKPVERGPSMDRVAGQLERRVETTDLISQTRSVVEAQI